MPHKETTKLHPGADTAVLFIHGICGSPNHFKQLLPLEAAVPQGWSIYNIVLDGHCKNVEDFGRSSMKKWKSQVNSVFSELSKTHEKVIVVGHSMGTLLAIDLALQYPKKVAFLFLLASPVWVAVQPRAVKYLIKIAFDCVDENNPVLVSMRDACGIHQTKKLWKYIPCSLRMIELLQLCRQTANKLSDLRVPCMAWQSEKDEMVSRRAGKLLRQSGRVAVHDLPNSTHFYYQKEDAEAIMQGFMDACEKYKKESPQ